MGLEKLRDKLIGLVLDDCETLSREFVQVNWDRLKYHVDESLERYSKFLIVKRPSQLYLSLQFIISILMFCLFYLYFNLSLLESLALLSFIVLNVDLIYYRDFQKLAHSLYIRFNYKVKNYCCFGDRFGYSLVYIASDPDDYRKIIVMSARKPKKNIKYGNAKLYVISRRCLYSVILDYKTSKSIPSLNDLKYDIYLSLNQEYINFRVIKGLEVIN